MAKQLYDYWFVQFDFPDVNGKPYKSSGGKMVWNEKLKREIPQGWSHGSLLDIANYTNGLACQKFRPTDESKLPVIKIKEMHDGLSSETEYVKADIPESVKVYDGDVLFSWSASLEVMLWSCGDGGLNQHIFKVTSKNGYPKSFYYYQLLNYVAHFKRMAEARKTTMGHITQEHLQQSLIVLPPNLDIANHLEYRVSPILEQIVLNNQEIIRLTKQRDELLPLLMNGQVSVKQLNNDLQYPSYKSEVDSILTYWKAYKNKYSLDSLVTVKYEELWKEYYSYSNDVKSVNIGFKVTPLKGTIQQLVFRYCIKSKISNDGSMSTWDSHRCLASSPIYSANTLYWEADYSDEKYLKNMSSSQVSRDYDFNIEIVEVRMNGENMSEKLDAVPSSVSRALRWGTDEFMSDYYADEIIKELINPDYVAFYDFFMKALTEEQKRIDADVYAMFEEWRDSDDD